MDITAAGADQRLIELGDVVCGHKQDATFRGGHAVDGVEQAGESDLALVVLGLFSLLEHAVDVFNQDGGTFGNFGEQLAKIVITDGRRAQVDDADVELQFRAAASTAEDLPLPGRPWSM